MGNINNIVRRFQFDLEMGVFRRYPYMNNTSYAFIGKRKDIGFLMSILDYLEYKFEEDGFDIDLNNSFITLIIDTKLSNYYYDLAEFADYENEIPDYIMECGRNG